MKIIIKNLQKKIPIYPKRIKKAVLKTLLLKGNKISGEITICFVDDKRIKELNLRFLGKNYATDVLSFDMSKDKNEIFADIAVSADRAMRNAKIFKTSKPYEVDLYVIHGVLHLLGYDDKTKKDRLIIRKKEKSLLRNLKL